MDSKCLLFSLTCPNRTAYSPRIIFCALHCFIMFLILKNNKGQSLLTCEGAEVRGWVLREQMLRQWQMEAEGRMAEVKQGAGPTVLQQPHGELKHTWLCPELDPRVTPGITGCEPPWKGEHLDKAALQLNKTHWGLNAWGCLLTAGQHVLPWPGSWAAHPHGHNPLRSCYLPLRLFQSIRVTPWLKR